MIDLRKLVALDMVLHGKRFIIAEFAFGVLLPLILGLFSFRGTLFKPFPPTVQTALGLWLLGIGVNYVPLLIYAILIARGGTIEAEGRPEMPHVKRYSLQQFIIFVPFLVAILAVVQELRRRM
jgi:hypothetical protein